MYWLARTGRQARPGERWVSGPAVTFTERSGQARFFVVGGMPFCERLLMWWNFVARNGEETAQAREDWAVQGSGRFGEVRGYPGQPLAAPPLPSVPLKPR